jgi:hypothetical protein
MPPYGSTKGGKPTIAIMPRIAPAHTAVISARCCRRSSLSYSALRIAFVGVREPRIPPRHSRSCGRAGLSSTDAIRSLPALGVGIDPRDYGNSLGCDLNLPFQHS